MNAGARFLKRHWFLVCLALALVVGMSGNETVARVAEIGQVRSGVVAVVLFLMGITLQPSTVAHSVRRPAASLMALAINMAVVPLLAAAAAPLLGRDLGGGLIVASAVPCTLASASVWVRRGCGNDAVAMLVTVVTNLLCFAVAPLTLWLLIGRSGEIDFVAQAVQLASLVVLPLVASQALRRLGPIAAWADRWKSRISAVAQTGILFMVAIGMTESMRRVDGGGLDGVGLLVSGALAISVHVAALWIGWMASRWWGLEREDRVAVAIAGSQKTLMVGLQLAIDCGVSMLPMIQYHVGQLVVDTLFVERDAVRGAAECEPQEPRPER